MSSGYMSHETSPCHFIREAALISSSLREFIRARAKAKGLGLLSDEKVNPPENISTTQLTWSSQWYTLESLEYPFLQSLSLSLCE